MRTYKVAVYYMDEAEFFQTPYGPPESSFTTPWRVGDLGFFRVHLAIIGPQPEESKYNFPLSYGQAQAIFKTISDIVKSLEEEAR